MASYYCSPRALWFDDSFLDRQSKTYVSYVSPTEPLLNIAKCATCCREPCSCTSSTLFSNVAAVRDAPSFELIPYTVSLSKEDVERIAQRAAELVIAKLKELNGDSK